MKYLEGEEKVSSVQDVLVLTNYRVVYQRGSNDTSQLFLTAITGIDTHHESKPKLAIIGAILILGSVLYNEALEAYAYLIMIVGFLLLYSYKKSRRHLLVLYNSGGQDIEINVKGISKGDLQNFVHQIEAYTV